MISKSILIDETYEEMKKKLKHYVRVSIFPKRNYLLIYVTVKFKAPFVIEELKKQGFSFKNINREGLEVYYKTQSL